MLRIAATIACTVALTALSADAHTFEYISRDSSVSTWGEITGAPPPADAFHTGVQSSALGLFDETVSDGASYGGVTAGGGASQLSNLLPAAITANGNADADLADVGGAGDAGAWADSLLEVEFNLPAAVPIELVGAIAESFENNPPYSVSAHVTLTRLGGAPLDLFDADAPGEFFFADTLAAGQYLLHAEAFIGNDLAYNAVPATGHAAFDLDLTLVPEPASPALLVLGVLVLRRR